MTDRRFALLWEPHSYNVVRGWAWTRPARTTFPVSALTPIKAYCSSHSPCPGLKIPQDQLCHPGRSTRMLLVLLTLQVVRHVIFLNLSFEKLASAILGQLSLCLVHFLIGSLHWVIGRRWGRRHLRFLWTRGRRTRRDLRLGDRIEKRCPGWVRAWLRRREERVGRESNNAHENKHGDRAAPARWAWRGWPARDSARR